MILEPVSLLVWDWVKGTAQSKFMTKAYHVVFKCSICLSGQIALWSYVAINYDNYNFTQHLTTILFTLFFSKIISRYA